MYVNWVRVWGVSDMPNVTTMFADPLKQKLLWSEEFSTIGAVNQVGLACLRGGGKGYREGEGRVTETIDPDIEEIGYHPFDRSVHPLQSNWNYNYGTGIPGGPARKCGGRPVLFAHLFDSPSVARVLGKLDPLIVGS